MSYADYNRRVTLLKRMQERDPAGQPLDVWRPFAQDIYANVRYANGKTFVSGQAEAASAVASIRIRYRTGVTEDMRVQLGNTVFAITAVLPDEQRRRHVDLAVKTEPQHGRNAG